MVVDELTKLQQLGISPRGNPALLYNMIRVSAGGLLALGLEVRGTSNFDFEDAAQRDELAEMIIRVFLPGNLPPQKLGVYSLRRQHLPAFAQ